MSLWDTLSIILLQHLQGQQSVCRAKTRVFLEKRYTSNGASERNVELREIQVTAYRSTYNETRTHLTKRFGSTSAHLGDEPMTIRGPLLGMDLRSGLRHVK